MFCQQLPLKAEQTKLDGGSTEIHSQNAPISHRFSNPFTHSSEPHEQLQLALPGALAIN